MDEDVYKSKFPPCLVMAVLYQLHVETFLHHGALFDDPRMVSIDTNRREALKRYENWVPCQCTRQCGKQWNFVNDIGLCKGSDSACDVEEFLQRKLGRSLFGNGIDKVLVEMRKSWKSPRIQS